LAAIRSVLAVTLMASLLAGCSGFNFFNFMSARDCMARAMYFESNRSSADGMLAVGTVVMNRVASKGYPKTVCGVVGQRNQFADGALTKSMTERGPKALAYQMADRVLMGGRHPSLSSEVKFFHTVGYSFPYDNMNYVLEAGGNNFYIKQKAGTFTNDPFAALAYW
jgi:spore germination cell wall hydrolase CwlJ-like protein